MVISPQAADGADRSKINIHHQLISEGVNGQGAGVTSSYIPSPCLKTSVTSTSRGHVRLHGDVRGHRWGQWCFWDGPAQRGKALRANTCRLPGGLSSSAPNIISVSSDETTDDLWSTETTLTRLDAGFIFTDAHAALVCSHQWVMECDCVTFNSRFFLRLFLFSLTFRAKYWTRLHLFH